MIAQALRARLRPTTTSRASPSSTPGSSPGSARSSRPRSGSAHDGLPGDRRRPARAQAAGLLRRAPRRAHRARRGRGRAARAIDLGVTAVFKRIDTCAAEFAAQTPYMYSTYEAPVMGERRMRGPALATARRSSSSAAARTASARASSSTIAAVHAGFALTRGGLRDDHGQLQPGDRLDRLRHLRPALFRAADRRRRARDPASRAGERHAARASSSSSAARRRSSSPTRSKRPASRSSAPRPTPSTSPRTASASSSLLDKLGLKQPENGIARIAERGARRSPSEIGYPARDPPVLRARRPRDGDRPRRRPARALHPRAPSWSPATARC